MATATSATTQPEGPFARFRDADHPVRWSPADGDTPAYLTIKGAAERLRRYFPADFARDFEEDLKAGQILRTPFAYYAIDEALPLPAEGDELDLRAQWGDA